jgi:Sulfatase
LWLALNSIQHEAAAKLIESWSAPRQARRTPPKSKQSYRDRNPNSEDLMNGRLLSCAMAMLATAAFVIAPPANAADKPNIVLIVSDDTGYGDLGPYGGGVGRGMPTPNIDKLAQEGMTFFSFYAQPSCTPGRAAMQTGRIPNRSGMTTVAFQGQGGGLPAAEWTLGSS